MSARRTSSILPATLRIALRILRHSTLIVTLLLCASGLIAACAFPGSVRPTVKIGLVAPFEGRYRYVGYDAIYAVRLALHEANDRDGLSGYGVELVAYDDGADPAMAVEQAQKLDVDPAVLGALGHFRQPTTAAAAGLYAEAGLPLLVPTGLDLEVGDAEGAYALGPPPELLASALLDRAARLADDDPVALVGDGGALGEALQQAARRRDLTLVVASAKGDGWRREILAATPAVLLCDLDPVRAGEVVAALRERGWGGEVLGGPALATSDFVSVAGAAAEGAVFVTPWPFPGDVAGGEDFVSRYRDVSGGQPPGPYALPTYEAAWMMLQAVEQAAGGGQPTRETVSNALATVRRDGLLGQLSLAPESGPDPALCWYRVGPDAVPRLLDQQSPQ